jgi:hypothetical protein
MFRFQAANLMHTQNRSKLGNFDFILVEKPKNMGNLACKTRVNYPVITASPCMHTQNRGKSGKSLNLLVQIPQNTACPNVGGGKSLINLWVNRVNPPLYISFALGRSWLPRVRCGRLMRAKRSCSLAYQQIPHPPLRGPSPEWGRSLQTPCAVRSHVLALAYEQDCPEV